MRLQFEQEISEEVGDAQSDSEQNQQLRRMAAYWKSEFEKQRTKLEEVDLNRAQNNSEQDYKNKNERKRLEAMISKLQQENKGIEDERKQLENELLNKTAGAVLSEEQRKAIEEEVCFNI